MRGLVVVKVQQLGIVEVQDSTVAEVKKSTVGKVQEVIVLEMQGSATSKVKEKQAIDDGTFVVNDLHLHLPKLF